MITPKEISRRFEKNIWSINKLACNKKFGYKRNIILLEFYNLFDIKFEIRFEIKNEINLCY